MGDTKIKGRRITVNHPDREIYAVFSDLRHFAENLPQDIKEKSEVTYDSDHLVAKVQGFELGVRIQERIPFSAVRFVRDGSAPIDFEFRVDIESLSPTSCAFNLELDAQLGTMLRMMVGSKLQEAIDKLTDELEKRLS